MAEKIYEFRIQGSDEVVQLPGPSKITVVEARELLSQKLHLSDNTRIGFVIKQGAYYKTLRETDKLLSKTFVKGITSFMRPKVQYEHPHIIVGAGQGGLRMGLAFLEDRQTNFVIVERRSRLGGTSWLQWANPESKVQTELGTYHLNWSEKTPPPKGMSVWPSRDQLLAHYQQVSDDMGITPHIMFNTDLLGFKILKDPNDNRTQHYDVQLRGNDGERSMVGSSIIYMCGNLNIPRRLEFPGEDVFKGHIGYGMFTETVYKNFSNGNVVIIGMGAFAIENVRSLCEIGVKKIFLVARSKNLCMPRLSSWHVNSSILPVSAVMLIRHMLPFYDLIGDDPFDYYSVASNAAHTHATIRQRARFGIGDVYFLSRYFGALEVIESRVQRLTPDVIHLENGRQLENVDGILKCLGFEGDWNTDKILQLKELTGLWVNKDYRRMTFSEFPTVSAQRYGGTSYSPGMYSASAIFLHMLAYPEDFNKMLATEMVPVHLPSVEKNEPGFVLHAEVGAQVFITISAAVPAMNESNQFQSTFKRQRQWETHSLEEVLDEARSEWFKYCDMFRDHGYQKQIPDYPFTKAIVEEMIEENDREAEALQKKMLQN